MYITVYLLFLVISSEKCYVQEPCVDGSLVCLLFNSFLILWTDITLMYSGVLFGGISYTLGFINSIMFIYTYICLLALDCTLVPNKKINK